MKVTILYASILASSLLLFQCSQGEFSGETAPAGNAEGGEDVSETTAGGVDGPETANDADQVDSGNPVFSKGTPGNSGGTGTSGSPGGDPSGGGPAGGGPSGGTAGSGTPGLECDEENQRVLQLPDYVEDCHSKGLMYNFNTRDCAAMPYMQGIDCADNNYGSIISTLEDVDPTTHLIDSLNRRKDSHQIVACGISNDRKIVVAQVLLNEDACAGKIRVLSLCHRTGRDEDLSNASADEKERVVNECLATE